MVFRVSIALVLLLVLLGTETALMMGIGWKGASTPTRFAPSCR